MDLIRRIFPAQFGPEPRSPVAANHNHRTTAPVMQQDQELARMWAEHDRIQKELEARRQT